MYKIIQTNDIARHQYDNISTSVHYGNVSYFVSNHKPQQATDSPSL